MSTAITFVVKFGMSGGQPVTTVLIGGHCIIGGVKSGRTMTLKEQVAELPSESLVVQTTRLVPSGKKLPLGGTHTRFVMTPQWLNAAGIG